MAKECRCCPLTIAEYRKACVPRAQIASTDFVIALVLSTIMFIMSCFVEELW